MRRAFKFQMVTRKIRQNYCHKPLLECDRNLKHNGFKGEQVSRLLNKYKENRPWTTTTIGGFREKAAWTHADKSFEFF
jgi:hypothetical protein